jgi:hypothetical protein
VPGWVNKLHIYFHDDLINNIASINLDCKGRSDLSLMHKCSILDVTSPTTHLLSCSHEPSLVEKRSGKFVHSRYICAVCRLYVYTLYGSYIAGER